MPPTSPPTDPFPEETARLAREAAAGARQGRAVLAAALLPLTPDPDPEEPDGVLDAVGVSWRSPAEALRGGVLGLCGCGSAEQIERDAVLLLTGARSAAGPPMPRLDSPRGGVRLYRELLLHLLTDAGLLEHGTVVDASWRTELGDRWAAALMSAVSS